MPQTIAERNAKALDYYHRHKEFINRKKREEYAENKGNPDHYRSKNNLVQQEKRRALLAELKAGPCMDCGGNFPDAVMEFHHRDPSEKDVPVSKIGYSRIREEAAKCDLLCANCHRIRHVTGHLAGE